MKFRVCAPIAAAALAVGLMSPAAAQSRPSIAVMPAGYFAADETSANNLTEGLAREFEGKGYTVIGADRAQSTFQSMTLNRNTHYADRVALRFGREMGADLVAYPRLLAVGIPMANGAAVQGTLFEPAAVVHLRVLNVRTGAPIYFRQIGHEFRTDQQVAGDFNLPGPIATAAAGEVTQMYFERVAGSRQETRAGRR
jgi:hypothetical protein